MTTVPHLIYIGKPRTKLSRHRLHISRAGKAKKIQHIIHTVSLSIVPMTTAGTKMQSEILGFQTLKIAYLFKQEAKNNNLTKTVSLQYLHLISNSHPTFLETTIFIELHIQCLTKTIDLLIDGHVQDMADIHKY